LAACSELVNVLMEYFEGRLPEERRRALEEHLSGCPDCVAAVNTYRSTVSLLRSLEDNDLPPDLQMRLRMFVRARERN
jgi:anti-sigma factor RsiW